MGGEDRWEERGGKERGEIWIFGGGETLTVVREGGERGRELYFFEKGREGGRYGMERGYLNDIRQVGGFYTLVVFFEERVGVGMKGRDVYGGGCERR